MRSSTSDMSIQRRARGRLLLAAVAMLAAGTTARAADLALPPPAPAAYNWTSVYIGVNGGYAGGTLNEAASDGSGSGSVNVPGGLLGGQVGADYQFGNIVVGGEADFDGVFGSQATTAVGTASGSEQIPWLGTLRARLGVAFDRFLVYGTAGGAGGELWSTVNVTGIGSAQTRQTFGTWTAGGGLEYAITNNLSARIEYLYFGSGDMTLASVGPPTVNVSGRVQENLVRAGLNLRLPIPH